MTDSSPVTFLVDLAGQLDARPGTPAAAFVLALDAWLDGRAATLDAALGLTATGPGKERALTRWRRARRNQHLRAALALVDGGYSWQRCLALAKEISRFESDLWPRWRDLPDPPDGASALRQALFHARREGALPTSPRQLSNIATNGRFD